MNIERLSNIVVSAQKCRRVVDMDEMIDNARLALGDSEDTLGIIPLLFKHRNTLVKLATLSASRISLSSYLRKSVNTVNELTGKKT